MRYILFIITLLVCACTDKSKEFVVIPKIYLPKNAPNVSVQNDIAYVDGKTFSGYLYFLNPTNNDTLIKEGYSKGLLHGTCYKKFPNGQLMESRGYKNGKKEGKQIGFWENGNKRFEFFTKNDVYEGTLKEWSIDGKLFHLGTYLAGKEDGTQKMWYPNGKIKANYYIIKGKRDGLLGTKNCKNVSDSIFVVQ